MPLVIGITREGATLDKRDAPPQVAQLIRRDLMVAPVSLNNPFPKKFRVFVERDDHWVVPLHWAREKLAPFGPTWVDRRAPAAPAALAFSGSLRGELRQHDAVRAVEKSWRECAGGALLCLPVGFGKTTAALYLASRVKLKTLVLVHKSFLKDQWVERVGQCLPGARVSTIQGDECDTTGDVVVAMIQTLLSRKFPASTFAGVGLVVVDEVHHLGAAAFSQCMWGQCAQYTLGLSATPTRKDGLSRVVTWFAGPTAFHLKRENQDTTEVRTVPYSSPDFDTPPPVNRRGDICFPSTITRLVENRHRTGVVARCAAALVADEDRDVLVLSHRRQHVHDLADAIRALGVASCGTYLGGDKQCPDTKVIVATYALTSEGFDLPRLNALVLATPASDVEQSCGRVMRGSATRGAIILDVQDQWGVCYAQSAKRRAFYKRTGFSLPRGGGGGGGEDREDRQDRQDRETVGEQFAFLDDAQ